MGITVPICLCSMYIRYVLLGSKVKKLMFTIGIIKMYRYLIYIYPCRCRDYIPNSTHNPRNYMKFSILSAIGDREDESRDKSRKEKNLLLPCRYYISTTYLHILYRVITLNVPLKGKMTCTYTYTYNYLLFLSVVRLLQTTDATRKYLYLTLISLINHQFFFIQNNH